MGAGKRQKEGKSTTRQHVTRTTAATRRFIKHANYGKKKRDDRRDEKRRRVIDQPKRLKQTGAHRDRVTEKSVYSTTRSESIETRKARMDRPSTRYDDRSHALAT